MFSSMCQQKELLCLSADKFDINTDLTLTHPLTFHLLFMLIRVFILGFAWLIAKDKVWEKDYEE